MFSIMRCQPDGRLEETNDLASLHSWLAESESRLWVDVNSPGNEEMEEIRRSFNFHPLTIEDCLHGGQRPKIEEYQGHIFLVLHTLPQGVKNSIVGEKLDEIYVYVTPEALVTIHQRDSQAVSWLRERLRKDPSFLTQPAGFLLHFLADNVVDQFFPFLDRLEENIDDLEDKILTSAHPAQLRRLFVFKRTLIHLRKSISPLREVFNGLSRRDYPLLDSKTALYFRDVYDHLIRASEIVDACRDLVATTVEAYLSAASNRMNEVMKQLTIMATIFLPLGVITGFFGMNFEQIPWKNPLVFLLTVVVLLAVPVVMIVWFARRGWLYSKSLLPKQRERHRDPNQMDID